MLSSMFDSRALDLAQDGSSILDLRSTEHHRSPAYQDLLDFKAWAEMALWSETSIDAYERTIAKLLRDNPHKRLIDLTDGDLMRFILSYPKGSQRIRKAHIDSFFKWARLTKRIGENPTDFLPSIKRPHQKHIDIFTPVEVASLEGLPSPDGHLMTLLLCGGLRAAEAQHTRWRNIDLNRELVIVSDGAKGSRDRVVPMMFPELVPAMANMSLLEGLERDDYLWYDKPGGGFARKVRRSKPISYTAFGRWWYRCLDEAEVKYEKRNDKLGIKGHGSPHTARHTFATKLKEAGVPVEDIQKFLGHASVSTTADLYVHGDTIKAGERAKLLLAGVA